MYRLSLVVQCVSCLWIACGCAPTAKLPPPAAAPSSTEEVKAIQLADGLLKSKQMSYGKAIHVEQNSREIVPGIEGPNAYVVRYPTPADEVKLLGEREIIVDIRSGRSEFAPRD